MPIPSPLASAEDLQEAIGEVGDFGPTKSLLRRASAIVRAYGKQSWGEDDEVPQEIRDVVVGMVERATRNPEGVTQETAGPFNRSFGPAAAERLFLTKWDKLVIRGAAGISGLGVISTTRGPVEMPGHPCP